MILVNRDAPLFLYFLQAYVMAEVQLWMLRVPLSDVENGHVTSPSALGDIALALPQLLTPPHFCRTGSQGGKEVTLVYAAWKCSNVCVHTCIRIHICMHAFQV